MNQRIDIELERLNKIKETLSRLIGIKDMDKYVTKELRDMYYEKNPDVFTNLVNAYKIMNEYMDENELLNGYDVFTEKDINNPFQLINLIMQNLSRGIDCGVNHTVKGQEITEENIYTSLGFHQDVMVDLVSIKDIKTKWKDFSEEEQEKITSLLKKKFDTHIWVLKDALDEAIENTKKDKKADLENNNENNGEDIDI